MAAGSAAATKEPEKSGPSFKGAKKLDLPDIEGYWLAEPNAEVEGKALGRFQIENDDGKVRDILVVELSKDATCAKKGGEKLIVKAGKCVGVGISHKNGDLLNYITKRGMVYCKALKKVDIGGGRKMWTYETYGEAGKEAPPPPMQTKAVGKGDGEDAPF
jgi:hypothetical protein